MNGNKLYPNDKVTVEGNDNPITIQYGSYRDLYGSGYVIGYYIPDLCKKVTDTAN